ncbi:hypothetical protein B0H10DRAFT_1937923 [Mycena sp. CBHHK59/15]|nr:hypothetical protein B0H10DRAFT_1937923 [Mycena sp. CBHHK59/15]
MASLPIAHNINSTPRVQYGLQRSHLTAPLPMLLALPELCQTHISTSAWRRLCGPVTICLRWSPSSWCVALDRLRFFFLPCCHGWCMGAETGDVEEAARQAMLRAFSPSGWFSLRRVHTRPQ